MLFQLCDARADGAAQRATDDVRSIRGRRVRRRSNIFTRSRARLIATDRAVEPFARARATATSPAAWKSQPRDVSSPLCGGDVTPSPRPPRARVPLTPIIADREPHPVSPTNRPPCPPSWASRSPRRCPGERPARPNPQDAFVTPVQSVKRQLYQTFFNRKPRESTLD